MIRSGPASPALHRFTCVTAVATFVLLLAGAAVTSTGSGLSVPDWPLSFGTFFPRMVGGVVFEHSHRLIAGSVALLILVLCAWMARAEGRPAVRRAAYAAGVLVVAQAALGGMTVLLRLPPAVSAAHAGMAQVVFTLVLALAVVTSRAWLATPPGAAPGAARLSPWAAATAALIYAQILVGAVMRHVGAGLACPDFPLCRGRLAPPIDSFPLAIHMLHRAGGVLVGASVLALAWWTSRRARGVRGLVRLARGAAALVVVQFVLGGLSVTTRLAVPITVAHLAGGALLLATVVVLALWSRRLGSAQPAPAPALAAPLAPAISG